MRKKRILSVGFLLCLTTLFFWIWSVSIPSSNAAKSSDASILQSIREKQDQISKAEKERNGLKNNLSDVQSIKKN